MYCFFDIVIAKHPVSTITFELYNKDLPKTCANFAALCEQTTPKLTYQNTKFFKVTKNILAQGGDVVTNDGRGSLSIYGPNFKDENFKYKHDQRGLLTMINNGPNTNGSQFAITFLPCPWLDRKQMVFGKVIEGQQTLTLLESIGTDNGVPKALAKIVSCGVALAPAPNSYLTQHKPIQTEESKAAEKQQSQHPKDQSRDLKSSLQSEDHQQYQDSEELGGSLQQSQFDQQQSKKSSKRSSAVDLKKQKDQSDDEDVDQSKDLKNSSKGAKDQSPDRNKSQKLDNSKDTSKSKEQSEIKVKGEDKKDDKNGKSDKKAIDDSLKKDDKAGNNQKEQREDPQDKKKQETQPEQQKSDKSQDSKATNKKK